MSITEAIKVNTGKPTFIHGVDYEIAIEWPNDGQLFFAVVRESHGELELMTIVGAHSSTEANPEGIVFTLGLWEVEGRPAELARLLSTMDETTAERVREILEMSCKDLTANTELLSA